MYTCWKCNGTGLETTEATGHMVNGRFVVDEINEQEIFIPKELMLKYKLFYECEHCCGTGEVDFVSYANGQPVKNSSYVEDFRDEEDLDDVIMFLAIHGEDAVPEHIRTMNNREHRWTAINKFVKSVLKSTMLGRHGYNFEVINDVDDLSVYLNISGAMAHYVKEKELYK